MAKDTRPLGHHPVSQAVARVRDKLSALVDVPLLSMDAAETRTALTELTRLAAQITELELRSPPTPRTSG